MFKITGYPKLYYYYKLMNKIIILMNKLNRLDIKIFIYKVKSHNGVRGNEKVDKLAKKAARLAKKRKYYHLKYGNTKWYNTALNPPYVDISFLFDKLHKKHKKERIIKWNEKFELYKNKNKNIFHNSEFLMYKMTINYENNKIGKSTYKMKNELKLLKPFESEIINRLRTEFINLNNYKYRYHNETNGMCDYCNCIDNVSHFLFDCRINKEMDNQIDKYRNKLYNGLRKTNVFFKNRYNITTLNMLFPHRWLPDPKKDDKKYYEKLQKNVSIRVNILKLIVQFVKNTKRFSNDDMG